MSAANVSPLGVYLYGFYLRQRDAVYSVSERDKLKNIFYQRLTWFFLMYIINHVLHIIKKILRLRRGIRGYTRGQDSRKTRFVYMNTFITIIFYVKGDE